MQNPALPLLTVALPGVPVSARSWFLHKSITDPGSGPDSTWSFVRADREFKVKRKTSTKCNVLEYLI
jgi:hypothetical protein